MVQMPGFYSQMRCKKKPPAKEVVQKETSF